MALTGATPSFQLPALLHVSFRRISILVVVCLVPVIAMGCAGMGSAAATSPQPPQNAVQPIQISASLHPGKTADPYNAVLTLSGGRAPYRLAVAQGGLPAGLQLNPDTGRISGTPSVSGLFDFEVLASDTAGHRGSKWLRIQIEAGDPRIQLSVSPTSVTLAPNGQQQFTAAVEGTSNSAVTWSASAGSITKSGLFIAPSAADGTQITVTATSVADVTQRSTGAVTVQHISPLTVTTSSLGGTEVNVAYEASLAANGGAPPYRWAIGSGSLPSGIKLDAATGSLSGTTSQQGQFPFLAMVSDAASHTATQSLTLAVSASSSGNFDGPAELPRVYIQSTLADTPAPGSTIAVNAGGDLQAALNSANCGDTIALQPGATFTGQFILPARTCDDQHWIIIRTAAPDSSLPPEGTRMTPCYAGVASLPDRPSFSCTSPHRVLPTIAYAGVGDGPVVFAGGANHYRLMGLEVTRAPGGNGITALVSIHQEGPSDHIVLDRLYIHGTAKDETRRGVQLGGGTNFAVQDSYISDFHCRIGGGCTDSQAVSGGNSTLAMGPYKIVNNFLEAAGENVMFGGGSSTRTPSDIEIRNNHFFKPMSWMQGSPSFSGMVAIVKNHLELKNAQRVLVDSNVMENTWGGFSQKGFSILITPKNQNSDGTGICPTCMVTDVTIRNLIVSHVGAVFQIANVLSPAGAPPLQGQRYSIHDVIADDINGQTYTGTGILAQVSTIPKPLLQSVSFQHITAFPSSMLLAIGGPDTVKMTNFTFDNSIVASGPYPIWSTGAYGPAGCAFHDKPLTTISACFAPYLFAHNAILDSPSAFPPSLWPTDNLFLTSAGVQFVNYHNGNGGDYHLLPSSPAKGAASDGTDMGANVDGVLTAVANVR